MSLVNLLLGLQQGSMPQGAYNPQGTPLNPNVVNPQQAPVMQQPEAIPEVPADPITVEQPPERKGMFGIHGTLRDILGTLADFRYQQQGREGPYERQKRGDEINNAMRGFADNPLASIRKVMAVDQKTGTDLMDNYRAQQIAQEKLAQERKLKGDTLLRQMTGAIVDEKTYQKMYPILQQTAKNYGIDISQDFGSTYDPDRVAAYRYGAYPVGQQETAEEMRRYHNIQDTNYDERTAISRDRAKTQAAGTAARISQGERRTSAYVADTTDKIKKRGTKSGSTPRPAGVTPPKAPPGMVWRKKGT